MALVYQFLITVNDTSPSIWRRIQVAEEYTFRLLHKAIQRSMGWAGGHLHEFNVRGVRIGKRGVKGLGMTAAKDEENARIRNYFSMESSKACCICSFGEGWIHDIVLEKIVPAETGMIYPWCMSGMRACPLEDCGGPSGYEELLEILSDPNNEEYAKPKEWVDEICPNFEPGYFDPLSVYF